MKRALDVVGLPVLAMNTGEEIGIVRDILCDLHLQVIGLVLQEAGWFQQGRYIHSNHIGTIGDDFITVEDKNVVTSMRHLDTNQMFCLFTGEHALKGKQAVTETGAWLGKVEDVYFSVDWERMVGYELSDGWIADITEGRKRINAASPVSIGNEHLIIPMHTGFKAH
ncbi:photosystem reaction center subunit H [Brevibacillus laterosporus]|uniref:PRC-barrel domain protein n=1 Tax=Brevibacillus laterosporus LMG 15441 TaxID=1042163 RepID=A0A075R7T6_BRELA|nr:PRC-barrel domain-containing protein [Brevibacillus laterosporus]AIG25645.1 PRC-barrel domain protein [Brevibacillus laterosporus LMG 15441]RJL08042.1 photosystem reaction center subunit H [Brevibacillus laterosporus]TPH11384.1 photosystem reaction center subunit H [Brevibacillus laterosporus]HAS02161.1 photosystem reaction center subunit H [Brevibacillus sp.]